MDACWFFFALKKDQTVNLVPKKEKSENGFHILIVKKEETKSAEYIIVQ